VEHDATAVSLGFITTVAPRAFFVSERGRVQPQNSPAMDDSGIALTGVPGAANSSDERRDNAIPKPPPADVDGIDPAIEKRLRRKLDRRVVGILFLLYLVAFLDRSNIGNAQTAGMGKDLGFDDEQFQVRG
jgi:hypothetical protein